MSEPIPESIPTSQDPRSKRPTKRRALTPVSAQAATIDTLFSDPSKVQIPETSLSTSTSRPTHLAPEIVANVQGSSAGAGSGEFHVYKAARRREYERLRAMDDEVRKEKADEEFEKKREEMRKRDEERLGKNRKRREKRKVAKGKGKGSAAGAGATANGDGTEAMDVESRKGPAVGGLGTGEAGSGATNPEEIGIVIHDDD